MTSDTVPASERPEPSPLTDYLAGMLRTPNQSHSLTPSDVEKSFDADRGLVTLVPPRDRSKIPRIRQRRHIWAHPASSTSSATQASESLPGSTAAIPKPVELTAQEGRIRWPLLWEQLGGDPTLVPSTQAQRDAVRWAEEDFMPGSTRHVGRLGRLMGEEEEMGAWQATAQNRARERRMQEQGEEFDSESDDEEEEVMGSVRPVSLGIPGTAAAPVSNPGSASVGVSTNAVSDSSLRQSTHTAPKRSQSQVEAEFEKRLLELFLDGLDTLDYDAVDFTPAEDPIADRDRTDAYFDDEAPSTAPGGSGNGHGEGDKVMENGQGEYDY
ncbi:hypothetical protein A1Q2_08260 [Trichosporon asahii var. asahii CBS 8904]|uniref:CCD97-like C-terminal domain-containing protein n=1 Tax=Trichosporon asahii var. asahii (strain CBS 8904) TaxID=1220162 RepID=K1VKP7_TRIAC|nr:hypothetical protein A1Q2_08260 [Trichosporon asahii var. asahii CBS 8904]